MKLGTLLLIAALCPLHALSATLPLDTFGITQFFPTLAGTQEWNSAHWQNGQPRRIQYTGDSFDPTGWTDNHSSGGGDSLFIDGQGNLLLNGGGPRFHINSTQVYAGNAPPLKVPTQFFLNVEATGYFKRLTTGGSAWDGMEIQVRTGPLGHASSGGNNCDATGLASRFRDDGKWDWEKELKHPDSKVYSTQAGSSAPLFGQGTLPLNRWIGMKFIVTNVNDGKHVQLETFIDSVSDISNGPPANGGHWEKVGSMIDDGTNFPSGDISGCPDLKQDMAITQGHGTILLRTDNESCLWTRVSIREINPSPATSIPWPMTTIAKAPRLGFQYKLFSDLILGRNLDSQTRSQNKSQNRSQNTSLDFHFPQNVQGL